MSKPITPEQQWNYLDGNLSPQEAESVEKILRSDAELSKDFIVRKELDQDLQTTELHQPSYRFSVNVMEEIGNLYQKFITRPLLPKFIVRGSLILFGIVLLITVVSGILNPTTANPDSFLSPYLNGVLAMWLDITANIPSGIAYWVSIIFFAFMLLFGLDHLISKNRKQAVN